MFLKISEYEIHISAFYTHRFCYKLVTSTVFFKNVWADVFVRVIPVID
jgi:hypothetical protein